MKNQILSSRADDATNLKGNFTPGPWKVETGPFPTIVCRDGGKFDGATICTEVCNGEANARLIAAAPDLLHNLKSARLMLHAWLGSRPKEWGPHPELERIITDVEAALAAAGE